MNIVRKKTFKKAYLKLSHKLQLKADDALKVFINNPYEKSLNNHALKGQLKGLRSLDVTGDLRILFKEKNGYITVVLITMGSHSQLY